MDKLRFWGNRRNFILQKIHFYGIWNKTVEIVANIILPVYFAITKNNPKYGLADRKKKPEVIVSLTSFPKRLATLHLVIETILRQTVKPDKVILYLTESQVPDVEKLPKKLLEQRKRGLEIVLCPDNIRSHTKYYYAFKNHPEATVITVDDDLFYRSDLIETHLRNALANPGCVVANWAKEIIPGKQKYTEWPDMDLHTPKKSRNMLILGVSSVLYPPHSVHEDVFDVDNIQKLSLTADDVWLSAMILKKGTPVYFSAYDYRHLAVHISNNETLISGNYIRNQQCIDAINNYYEGQEKERPFIDIPKRNIEK
ncbi:hypothetical protein [Bacteroides caecimuris]|uniref:hypothetical protein n=1 Tax=Bacteroides caecimuris TaxID=1796613 RepID=UPI0026E56B59|nr:hypothetical protein [Bacteroides caecimuris]